MKAAISFDGVSKKFVLQRERARSFQEVALDLLRGNNKKPRERFWALRDVSFVVGPGETVGLVGPNGAGKSTALKLITRIIQPTGGRIEVNGRIGALLELGAGFHPDLTGRENIYLNGSILGLRRADIRQKLDEIVAFAELERFIDMPVKRYSSGMYVRLGFSVAVHTEPEVLLVDEVLAVGDQGFQRKCMDRIYDMKRAGTTIFLVSHGIDTVALLCDRAIWLDEGRVLDDGPARDVVEAYLVNINAVDEKRLRKEADKTPSLSATSSSEASNRSGSGEVQVVDVVFLDREGNPREVFSPGEEMRIRIVYEASQRIENPVFGIGLHRADNVHIAGPNTSMADYPIPVVEGRGVLNYVIAELPLMAGRYELSSSIYDATISHKYDYLHRAFSFSIQPRSTWDKFGVLRLHGQWSLQTYQEDGGDSTRQPLLMKE